MLTVGIIGAGASGLCALKNCLPFSNITPVVWEKSSCVGGTWVYSDNSGEDEFGLKIHSSMYKSLRTDIPKEVMAFPDFPFPKDGESFMHHTTVRQYLDRYADHFTLKKHIKFCHLVEEVSPIDPDKCKTKWQVTVRELQTGKVNTTVCDVLFVCSGQFSVPYVPSIPGIQNFKGMTQHSHYYRVPDAYKGKTVIVLGASASGRDICLELSSVANKVYLSHNLSLPFPSVVPSNVHQVCGVERLKPNTDYVFILKNGEEIEADAFIYCTGYEYSYPFLTKDCGIESSQSKVWPLYQQIINARHLNMAFIGVPFHVIPFPLFDLQVRYFLYVLFRKIKLPSSKGMMSVIEKDLETKTALGMKASHYHSLAGAMWEYADELEKEIKAAHSATINGDDQQETFPLQFRETFPLHVRQIFNLVIVRLITQMTNFKNYNYSIRTIQETATEAPKVKVEESLSGTVTRPARDIMALCLSMLPWYVLCNFKLVMKYFIKAFYYKIKGILFYRNR